jgi:hypothetical protein
MSEQMVKIRLRGSVPDEIETLWATPLGDDNYRLDNSPFYAYGISWEDIVEAFPSDDGFLEFARFLTKSGNRTLRVIMDSAEENPKSRSVLERITELGCSYEGLHSRLISINVPPDADFDAVTTYLTNDTEMNWEYADPTYEEITGEQGKSSEPD